MARDIDEYEERLAKLAIQLKDKDKDFNVVTDENSGIVDACNQLIDELNQKQQDMEDLDAVNEELKKENEQLKARLLSKKRDIDQFSQQQF